MGDLLDEIDSLTRRPGPHLVITPNVDMVVRLATSVSWNSVFRQGDLYIADGRPVVALCRLMGARRTERLTGADLLMASAAAAKDRDWRIALVGGSDHTQALAIGRLNQTYPGSNLLPIKTPHFASGRDPEARTVVDRLRETRPDLVFLCLGSPKQELFFAQLKDHLPPAVYVGAGAAVDFAAGTAPRAPVIVQRLGLEWLHRLAHDPRRLARRYLVRDPAFLPIAAASVARHVARRTAHSTARRTAGRPARSAHRES
jgi:N-acetylglucosaminyldiphosphoundecaprenol N-acetyl-beta-D-mannosaminyltransferase